jgi:hypothetical protein
MALDSVSKRLSAMNIGSPWRGLLPIPDGTLGQGDRQHVLFLCSAVLAGEAVAPGVFGDLTTLFAGYVDDLKDANATRTDSTTLVEKDRPTVVGATNSKDDLNTAYAEYLSA